jgi:hypothetical protein
MRKLDTLNRAVIEAADDLAKKFKASDLLKLARAFESKRLHRRDRTDITIPTGIPTPEPIEILTPEELMGRLKVGKGWIAEKRRPRCIHPLPALTNRPLRFNWYAIVAWLQEEAAADAARLQHKRSLPIRHNAKKSHPTTKSA